MSVGPIGRGAASLLAGLGLGKVGPQQGPAAPRPPVDGVQPFPARPSFQQRYQQDAFEGSGKKGPSPMQKPKPKKPIVRPPPKPILGAAFKPAVVGGQVQMERQTMGERRAEVPSNIREADDGTTAQMMVQLAQKM